MGSYFAKPNKVRNITFESLERGVESMNVQSYPSFDKSSDWAKTRHIYSEQICFHEKYLSWSVLGLLLLLVLVFLYLSYANKDSLSLELENSEILE
jgi:hypothetical protein